MFEIDRTELIKEAIKKAYEDVDRRTIIDEDTHSKRVFYFKNGAIWCKLINMKNGNIWADNRVYKINTDKPYIRDMGSYWYLEDREKAILKEMIAAVG